jgi:hypothetical protein
MKYDKAAKYLLISVLAAAPVILLGLIFCSTGKLLYDERNFFANIHLLRDYGLSFDFLRALKNQSPGPLYQLLYYPLFISGIKAIVAYRTCNFIFATGIVYFLYKLMSLENVENPVIKALLFFSIPLSWTTGGLALTEIPTIFFALVSLYTLRLALDQTRNRFLLLVCSGLFLGFTIIGRTPFLMIVPAAGYLFIRQKQVNKGAAAAYFIFAMLFPAIIFYAWGGLVPPDVQTIQSGIKPLFLAYSLSYICLFIFIIYPQWYKIPRIYYMALLCLLAILFVLNTQFFRFEYLPMKSLSKTRPKDPVSLMRQIVSLLIPCVMYCLALLHIIATIFQVKNNKNNAWQIFLVLIAALIALTTLKSAAQFSTRYPYQSFPFLLLFCARYIKPNAGLAIRALIGIAIGIISLLGYYHTSYLQIPG